VHLCSQSAAQKRTIREFFMNQATVSKKMDTLKEQLDTTKKLWWLHDSYWHATIIKGYLEKLALRKPAD
jgi:hypothetical protein